MRTARRRWAPLMIVAAVVVTAAAPATAAEFQKKSWEVGGYLFYTTYDNDSLIKDAPGWGVRGGFNIDPRHEVEMNFKWQSADSARKNSDVTFDITRWDVTYVYNLKTKKPDSKLIPFVDFGVGKMTYDDGDSSDNTTNFKTGGGIRIFFTKRLALRFDANIFHFHGDGTIIPRNGWYSLDSTLGVSFAFGGGA
jgi:outer membrane protein with beta-barrel domain